MLVKVAGAILNVGRTDSPYYSALVLEGLWGVSAEEFGQWLLAEPPIPVLLYMWHRGVWGLWAEARLVEKFENPFPVSYWFRRPYSRPFQLRLRYVLPERVDLETLDTVRPLRRQELWGYGFRPDGRRRWTIRVFAGDKGSEVFGALRREFRKRNL